MSNNIKMSSTKNNVLYKKYEVFWTVGSRTNYKFVNETLQSVDWGLFYNLRLKQSKKFKLVYATVFVDCTNESLCNDIEKNVFVKLDYKNNDDVTRFWKMVLNKHAYASTSENKDSNVSVSNDDELLRRKNANQANANQNKGENVFA